jgi:hypothetical protein
LGKHLSRGKALSFALLRNADQAICAFAAYRVYMGSATLMLGPLAHDAISFNACIKRLADAEKKGGSG